MAPDEGSDSDGECDLRVVLSLFGLNEARTVTLIGDNNSGYLGYRSSARTVSNNGAIDEVVVRDWLH